MINTTTEQIKDRNTKSYPKYMISKNDAIVLFARHGVGMIIKGNSYHKNGHYSEDWDMDSFTDYNDVITTQNS